jgi:NADPH-dependent ferric siderophore reductase
MPDKRQLPSANLASLKVRAQQGFSMANIISKAIFGLMEKALGYGEVVAVRRWNPATMVEADLYMPDIDVSEWNTIKRLKTKVGECEYRDYTPALWDAQRGVCTIYAETGHQGTGSSWANNLKKGDTVLFAPAHATVLPAQKGKILGLGDGSALGHFLALKQLTNRRDFPMDAVVFLTDNYQLPKKLVKENPEIQFIAGTPGNSLKALLSWTENNDLSQYVSIYIAGNTSMVREAKKILRYKNEVSARLYSAAFWK